MMGLPACLLVVDTKAAASSTAMTIGVGIQCFLAHEFGNIFVSFLLVAAEVEKLIAQATPAIPTVP